MLISILPSEKDTLFQYQVDRRPDVLFSPTCVLLSKCHGVEI